MILNRLETSFWLIFVIVALYLGTSKNVFWWPGLQNPREENQFPSEDYHSIIQGVEKLRN